MNEKVSKIETEYNTIQIARDRIDLREYHNFNGPVDCAEEILNEINNQDLDKFRDLDEYAKGPWMTLKEFEENLKKSELGHQARYNKMVNNYEKKINYIQHKTAFRDEAIELAMLYNKIICNEKVEQSQMEKEDIDSQFFLGSCLKVVIMIETKFY